MLWAQILPAVPATIQRETDDLYLLRLSGAVSKDEFAAAQDAVAPDIDAGARPRILAVLENFDGWDKNAAWGDLEFLFWHSGEIAKIAIVGEPRWQHDAMAFAGAGSRPAPVSFFLPSQLAEARAWLSK